MAYFLVIRGPLGVGKTTISKKLASILHGEHISVDSVLEQNYLDKIEGRAIPLKNFLKANRISVRTAKREMRRGKIIIFDGNFYYKEQIKHLFRSLKARHFVFTLKAPLNACIRRNKTRKVKYDKESVVAVHRLVSRFDYGTVIDTNNKTPAEVTNEIVSHLPKT